ncbi:aminotransferase class I/II-fold pyridoxal phosphate-dependent enzyme [Streptomyces sp. NRRL S-118]|uniref:aminotransferase class I/II-fold pyridoxal phosphate-dependent enzyme n=1 Tax=Streptomyces sp. NRRL S-118 TaxID=1463881 RepID=UPI0004C8ADCC|nr:pyridoxal phosphate-dependent aminotransferase family protein [Streptomyces sp. NRRL S-118]
MTTLPGWNFEKFAEGIRAAGMAEPPVSGVIPGPVHGTDRMITNLASVNFLDLQRREDVMKVLLDATQQYGLATGGSRILQGVMPPHIDMERTIADYLQKESAISFATGTLANIGFMSAMAGTQSLMKGLSMVNRDVVFVFDRDAHWSLWKSAENLKFGERLFAFEHNSVESLEAILKKLRGKRVVVVFESVYSIDGVVAPMHEIVDVCEKYGALSYVDDANGFMVYGPPHRKFHQEYQGLLRSTFIMVSLKKAVGLEGGLIAGPKDAITSFELLSGASAFTAGVLAPAAAGTAYISRLLAYEEPEIVDNYLAKVADFRKRLLDEDLPITDTETCFTSLVVGDEHKCLQLFGAYLEHDIRVPPYVYPAARRAQAVLRIIINASHTEEQLDHFIEVSKKLRDKKLF